MVDDERRNQSASHYTRLPPTPGLMAVVSLAARVTGCPVAMINVVDGSHQYTVAAHGFDAGTVVPLETSACAGVIARGAPVLIPDVVGNNIESDIAEPVHDAGFRAYAGVPLMGREDLPVATLCVVDTDPHADRDFDLEALKNCAVLAGEALEAARSQRQQPMGEGSGSINISEVAAALDNGEIIPWYMPIVDLQTGEVMAMEALARWIHPDRGVLAPDAFIPLVEHTDLIIDFDLTMLAHAVADLTRWRSTRDDADNVAVAVNFSAHHFYRPDCADRIDKVTSSAGVSPESVILEITETVAVATTALIDAHVIDDLRGRGYTIAFDDIGGNWLPAEHLLRVNVDGLKADRTVGSSLHTPAGRAIARALTALTAELGQFLVIEGIETAEHAHQARIIGAGYGQGYLWSPAKPADVFPVIDTPRPVQAT
jgi:EAL domain-containing protein (putative c-di-GMP-specific phosphodiesterase class I)